MWRGMCAVDAKLRDQVNQLVDAYRGRCLWFLKVDYYPATREEMLRTLDYVSRYGDLEAFRQAGGLHQWLSPDSNATSAGS